MIKNILALDFDGTLAQYKEWGPPGLLKEPPVPGAVEACHEYDKQLSLHVYSHRATEPAGDIAIREYLKQYKFPPGMKVSPVKPPAILYVDDRGFQFNGSFPSVDYILNFKPWYEHGPAGKHEDAASAALSEIKQVLDEHSERLQEMSGDKDKPVVERIRAVLARIAPKK